VIVLRPGLDFLFTKFKGKPDGARIVWRVVKVGRKAVDCVILVNAVPARTVTTPRLDFEATIRSGFLTLCSKGSAG
jgi:hypothetical protein